MENPNPRPAYQVRIEKLEGELLRLKKVDRRYIVLKFLIFFGGLLGVSQFFPARLAASAFLFAGGSLLFLAAIIAHEKVLGRIRFRKALREIQVDEIRGLGGEFPAAAADGGEFIDVSHPYTSDLDIFGPRSLFHFLNRAVTGPGGKALAERLKTKPNTRSIAETQEGVRELSGRLDFRHVIRAHGAAVKDAAGIPSLAKWPDAGRTHVSRKTWFPVLLYGLPVLTVGSLGLIFAGFPWVVFAGFFLAQTVVNRGAKSHTDLLYRSASADARILKAYARIIRETETESFAAPALAGLQDKLRSGTESASRSIQKLARLLEWLDLRSNKAIHGLLNNIVLWDLFFIRLIERWKAGAESRLGSWFEAVGDLEALSSLANLAFNNPDWAFPQIVDGGFKLKASDLGHPLIPRGERVGNDFVLEGRSAIAVITGPNMAGKSTFLRTVGINAVLALAGAPVCAAAMEISRVRLATSMKSSDSLDKHMSLFYAELKRLKMVLDTVRDHPDTLFMIDEMLKGTNEMDRHRGAAALLRQLVTRGATGLVATHDLELTRVAADEPTVRNYHFDGNIEDDKLLFDFKLRPGICRSFNALHLMKTIGIDV